MRSLLLLAAAAGVLSQAPPRAPASRQEPATPVEAGTPGDDAAKAAAGVPGRAPVTPQAIENWIKELRDPDPNRRWGAVSELGSLQVTRAVPEIIAGLVRCRDGSGDWHVFWRSLWALNNMPEPKAAVPAMRAAFRASKVWRDRWNAAVGLSYLRVEDPEAVAFLFAALDGDTPAQLKSYSITSLSYAQSESLFKAVETFIANPDPGLRGAVLDALRHWRADDERRSSAIIRMLDDTTDGIRWRAAMHLGRHRTEAVVAALRGRLEVETDANVRKHLKRSLVSLGEELEAGAQD